jgi:MFS family permease
MGMKSVRLLTLLMVGMGMIVGTVDIVSVAYAREWGYPAAASLILAAYAIGSCLAGLLFGSFRLKTHSFDCCGWGAGNRSHHGSSDPCHPPQRIDLAVLVAGLFLPQR